MVCFRRIIVDKIEIISELVLLNERKNKRKQREERGKRAQICGDYKIASVWKDGHGKYDRILLGKRDGQS